MVVTFSIRKNDVVSHELVEDVKKQCLNKGLNFSYIVLEALKQYVEKQSDVK